MNSTKDFFHYQCSYLVKTFFVYIYIQISIHLVAGATQAKKKCRNEAINHIAVLKNCAIKRGGKINE